MSGSRKPILVTNGNVIDGTGNPWYNADVLIENGRVSLIGASLLSRADQVARPELDLTGKVSAGEIDVIDARGRYVTPGFIDIHSHSDLPLFVDGTAQSYVRQGVTTQVVGNCGGWSCPLHGEARVHAEREANRYGFKGTLPWTTVSEYMDVLQSQGVSMNVAVLVGHGSIRAAVSGFSDRPLTEDEMQGCEGYLAEAMEQGAVGMSTGLYYAPGSYATKEEIVRLCEIVRSYDGIHTSHIRDESDYNIGLMAALDEVIDIGRQSGVKTEISHLKCLGPRMWGKSGEVLAKVEAARSEGLDVTADQYPYVASGSSITGALIPRWAQEGTHSDMVARLKDPAIRAKMKREVEQNLVRRGGADRLKMTIYLPDPSMNGLSLADAASRMKMDPAEAALTLLEESDAPFVSFVMDENDVRMIMQAPWVMTGSDGWALADSGPLGQGQPHPRSFGSFVRVLAKYALRDGVLRLEDAVRKMTSLPANRLGLTDRGLLKVGMRADVVVFNPKTINDEATFEDPKRYPSGIEQVIVNGVRVVVDGAHTGRKPGTVLRHV
ncbi:MAG: D-aminoacylase [Bacillota bacterium]